LELDDGGGCDNCGCKMCKAPVTLSPPTNQPTVQYSVLKFNSVRWVMFWPTALQLNLITISLLRVRAFTFVLSRVLAKCYLQF